jgi:hypothetical protein
VKSSTFTCNLQPHNSHHTSMMNVGSELTKQGIVCPVTGFCATDYQKVDEKSSPPTPLNGENNSTARSISASSSVTHEVATTVSSQGTVNFIDRRLALLDSITSVQRRFLLQENVGRSSDVVPLILFCSHCDLIALNSWADQNNLQRFSRQHVTTHGQ